MVVVSDSDIQAQSDEATVLAAEGESPYPALTYADGVRDALQWVLGETDEAPLDLPEPVDVSGNAGEAVTPPPPPQ